jgi:hypothetical protein
MRIDHLEQGLEIPVPVRGAYEFNIRSGAEIQNADIRNRLDSCGADIS